MNKDKEYADEKDDRTWQIIPIVFSEAFERTGMSRVITYDAHVNTCVFSKMKEH